MSRMKLALEVVSNLRNLADSIEDLVEAVETNMPEPKIEQATKEEKLPTLEEVRHYLAMLSQSGKQAEVKALITRYGARKLSDIPQEKYPELLKDAGEIQ
jgi:hypothetical protein